MFQNDISNSSLKIRVNFNLKSTQRVGGHRAQIWLCTTINGTRVRIYTRQLIDKENWVKSDRSEIGGGFARVDNTLDRVSNSQNKAINNELKRIISYIDDYMKLVCSNHLQSSCSTIYNHTPKNFKEYIESRIIGKDYRGANNPEVFISEYIEKKRDEVNSITRKTISKGTIYNHANALNRLKKYLTEKRIKFSWNIFDEEFERLFTSWMHSRKYTPNTISSQFSIIKVWLGEAEKKGFIENKYYRNYHTSTSEVENIYLTEDEIKRIYELDLTGSINNTQSQIEETRDLFVIGCWTGLRYSDYSSLPPANAEDDTITLRTHKTNTKVVIPMHPMVKAIYDKYRGVLPKPIDRGKAMSHIRKIAKKAGIVSDVTINKIIGGEVVTETKPKWKCIMNHTARRSFATNMYLRQVPTISIMAITGHTTEANFMRYIKVDKEQHAKIVASIFNQIQ